MATPLSSIHLPSSASCTGAKTSPATAFPPVIQRSLLSPNWNRISKQTIRLMAIYSAPTNPGGLSEKVSESIKKAEEACEGDPKSGECAAAWDEVEELSAAASHARDRAKSKSDPLENYCEDNPEVKECRTYED
ncbi:calvin cycle protein CP12-2, chloroplastic-like [Phalaenopsis equestris]|uniref:calvin cycle protein CP12-2, chloroplastic-like n=1 Tax=Phalaenopsis equestris TaxID=78828 RepID=UPI0009E408F7|nr:calvin cycle protein CP12-2, chloroplastic-like [Phalaenopsis equestris]